MNKKHLISVVVIVFLLAIVIVKKNIGSFSSDVPDLSKWEESATSITIKKAKTSVDIYKKDKKWVVGKEGFLADAAAISSLEKKLNQLELTDLITKNKFYQRFELNPDQAIQVVVKRGEETLRELSIGKVSSTGQQVYVKLAKYDGVFLASGNLKSEFDKSINDLRDKRVLSVNQSEIKKVVVKSRGSSFSLQKEEAKATDKDDKKKEPKAAKSNWVVAGSKNVKLEQNKVTGFINSFSDVKAESFASANDKGKSKLSTITVVTPAKSYVLSIIKKEDDDKYLCSSSESEYQFFLSKYQALNFLKKLKDLQ